MLKKYLDEAYVGEKKVYDVSKIIDGLRRDGMSLSEAREFFTDNYRMVKDAVFTNVKPWVLEIENPNK